MKKIFLINLFACAVLCIAFVCAKNKEQSCSMQCVSEKNAKQQETKVIGGGEKDEQLFQFNRIYIKL